MGEIEDLLALAERYMGEVLRHSSTMLGRGADPARVHRRYISAAYELREEAELRALVARAEDPAEVDMLAALTKQLGALAGESRAEAGRQADADAEL